MQVENNLLVVVFHSDYSVTGRGFNLVYSVVQGERDFFLFLWIALEDPSRLHDESFCLPLFGDFFFKRWCTKEIAEVDQSNPQKEFQKNMPPIFVIFLRRKYLLLLFNLFNTSPQASFSLCLFSLPLSLS